MSSTLAELYAVTLPHFERIFCFVRARLSIATLRGYNRVVPPVSHTIRVNVLFFGQLKEFLGRAQESIELQQGSCIQDLFQKLASCNPELQKFHDSLVAARNQEFAAWRTPLQAGDEIAFLPPVSGG